MYKLKIAYPLLIVLFFSAPLAAQHHTTSSDTSLEKEKTTPDHITLTVYARVISNAGGHKRVDENIVGNFKLLSWLRLEAGFRQGERPHAPDSYYHYKLELQTKYFWNRVRFIAKLSDNIINLPSPSYRKTNALLAVEAKHAFSSSLQASGGVGYVSSAQQLGAPDFLPTSQGTQLNYPVFKLALKYRYSKRGLVEGSYGSYDVFNPYYYNSPFAQLLTEFEISHACTFYSYFRYQYNNYVFRPENYFLCAGLQFHLGKK